MKTTKKKVKIEKRVEGYDKLKNMIIVARPVPSPMVRVKVSGYVTMTRENLEGLKAYDNVPQAITYALHCQYVDTNMLEYEEESDTEKVEREEREEREEKWHSSLSSALGRKTEGSSSGSAPLSGFIQS